MEDENKKLKKKLVELFIQFDKQDNPIILREISLTAYKLMNNEKEDIICCPHCKEIGLMTSYNWPVGDSMQVFMKSSTMRCENKHKWEHEWKVGDKIIHYEPVNQYYVYKCEEKISEFNIQFKRLNGVRHFPGDANDSPQVNDKKNEVMHWIVSAKTSVSNLYYLNGKSNLSDKEIANKYNSYREAADAAEIASADKHGYQWNVIMIDKHTEVHTPQAIASNQQINKDNMYDN